MGVQLIDLSSNNPLPYDFHAAKAAGIDGVFLKLSEGAGYINPYFAQAWIDAKAAGLWRGAYLFAQPTQGAPEAQAAYALAHLPTLEPGDGFALDFEVPGAADPNGWAVSCLGALTKGLGFHPFFYSYLAFIEQYLSDTALATCPLWLAAYISGIPQSIPPWTQGAKLWQYTETGRVAGITGNVDISQSSMSRAELNALGKPSPTPTVIHGRVIEPGVLKSNASHASKPIPNPAKPDQPYELPVGTAITYANGTGKDPQTGESWQAIVVDQPSAHGWFLSKRITAS